MLRNLVIALMILAMSFAGQRAQAESTSDVPHFFKIPVFFVTDRNVVHQDDGIHDFGMERQYRTHCQHDPTLGICYGIIPNHRHKPLTQHMKDLGWTAQSTDELQPKHRVQLTGGTDYADTANKFFEKLNEQSKTSENGEVLVFAPGYMSTFASGVSEAAAFAYYSERPSLLYSWASAGKFKKYSSDETTCEWSQDHFNTLINRLSQMSKESQGRFKVHLIAHSMGGRLVLRAVPLLARNPAFDEITLVCPDCDDGIVEHYASRYVSNEGTAHVRLYASDSDKMLKLSKLVHGGYIRLGQTALPGSANMPQKKPSQKTPGTEQNGETAKHRFQTINFTALDAGPLGHKIPVELICSVSQTGRSCEGIKLVMPTDNTGESHKEVASVHSDSNAITSDYLFAYHTNAPKFKVLSAMKKKVPMFSTMFNKDWTMK